MWVCVGINGWVILSERSFCATNGARAKEGKHPPSLKLWRVGEILKKILSYLDADDADDLDKRKDHFKTLKGFHIGPVAFPPGSTASRACLPSLWREVLSDQEGPNSF